MNGLICSNGGLLMVIKGTDLNSICLNAAKTLSKPNGNASFTANNSLFSKRFDTLELSEYFKRFSSADNKLLIQPLQPIIKKVSAFSITASVGIKTPQK